MITVQITPATQLIPMLRPPTRAMSPGYVAPRRPPGCNAEVTGDRTAQPFVAPAVRPPTMYFCRNRNRIITGIAAMTAPALKADQSA